MKPWYWKRLLMIVALLGLGMNAMAITPDVRLPQWNELACRVVSWAPSSGMLTVEITLRALEVPISDLSARVVWPKGFSEASKDGLKASLKARETWTTLHSVKVPGSFEGWIDLEIFARPDSAGLKKTIAAIATLTPVMREILNLEAGSIQKPLSLGWSVPLHLDEMIGLTSRAEFLFAPSWPAGEKTLLLWVPPIILGSGQLTMAYESMKKAIAQKDSQASLEAIARVEALLPADQETISVSSGPGTGLSLIVKPLKRALRINRTAIKGLQEPKWANAELETLEKDGSNVYERAVIQANRGVLLSAAKQNSEAKQAFEGALKLHPAWPLVEGWLKGMK